MNKVILCGNLGRDPEVKFLQSGSAVCEFPIATSEKWTDKSTGEAKERTEWHTITVWGKSAEHCGKYLAKGRQVLVEGSIRTDQYEKDGETRYRTKIVAQHVRFLGGNGNGQQQGHGQQVPAGESDGPTRYGEDDIPF